MELLQNHYAVLGLTPGADEAAIKKAFRRLARIHHPDHRGDPLRFHAVLSAYRLLLDPVSRLEFDRSLVRSQNKKNRPPSPYLKIPARRFRFPTVADLARRGLLRRDDRWKRRFRFHYDLELLLEPEEFRKDLQLEIPAMLVVACPDCRGTDPDCPACQGRGSYKAETRVRVEISGGTLSSDQILRIDLARLDTGRNLAHFRKKTLLIRVMKNSGTTS